MVNVNPNCGRDSSGKPTAVLDVRGREDLQRIARKPPKEMDKKLHEKTVGSQTFLQSVDMRYNIRGWMRTINSSQLTVNGDNDEGDDYFGMELVYNTAEAGLGNTLYYNGNISAAKWKGFGASPGPAADQRSYKYVYDKSDRMKSATFQAHNGTAWAKEAGTLDEGVTYDHNGNIKTLVRKQNQRGLSGTTVTSVAQTVDNLTYTYASNLNKLTKVEDAVAVATGWSLAYFR
jgi:YD repeat-containing protein